MTQEKLKKVVSITVFAATIVLVALILTMIILFIVKGNLKGKENKLLEEKQKLEQEIVNIDEEIDYRKSDDYIKKYWLQYGYIQDDSTKFVPA